MQTIQLTEVAETLRDDSFLEARELLTPTRGELPLKTLLEDLDFVDCFKHNLASGIARVLAAYDRQVKAVHFYDPLVCSEGREGSNLPIDATIHLLVEVRHPSPALSVLVGALDHALTESLKELPSALFVHRQFTLDVNVLTPEDIKVGRGHATLLSSLYTPPLIIWRREDEA
jgi:hypothetical protein